MLIDGINPNDPKKQKILHFTDKLSLTNMAASSGLRENVHPIIFLTEMLIFINVAYVFNIYVAYKLNVCVMYIHHIYHKMSTHISWV